MYKLIRFWHQNKNQIIKVLAVIVFIFLVIQVINLIIKKCYMIEESFGIGNHLFYFQQ